MLRHSNLRSTSFDQRGGVPNGNIRSSLERRPIGRSGSSTALWTKQKNSPHHLNRHSSNAEINTAPRYTGAMSYTGAGGSMSHAGVHITGQSSGIGGYARKTKTEDFRARMEERQKKPKIIFLDVDGVLHSIRVARQEQLFNPQKMALLRKIIQATDAQIVLSSAWRRTGPTLRMAYQMLNKHGIETPIDVTPDYGICGKRSAEILTWVDKYQIRDWIAIDDLDLNAGEPRMRPHFIKCNPLIGLTNDLVDQGVAILNQNDGR